MAYRLTVPRPVGGPLELDVDAGQSLFVLGANGTGKSSVMHHFYAVHHAQALRISAHRRTWMSSNAISLSPGQKRNSESSIVNFDAHPNARWRNDYATQRAGIAIYDLIDAENVRARAIAAAVTGGDIESAKELAKRQAPVAIINELLRLSNMPVEISVRANEQVLASKSGSTLYSLAELSDGERNALLLGASVLTAKPGTLILIDEPESTWPSSSPCVT